MSDFLDKSLVSDFVTESREHLDAIKPDLLRMAEGEVSPEVISRVFRVLHSIKGGAGFLAYDSLKNLSYRMENVLMMLRDGELPLDSEVTTLLLQAIDRLRSMVDDIESSENVPCERELTALKRIIESQQTGETVAGASDGSPTATDTLFPKMTYDQEETLAILGRGRFVYLANVRPGSDFGPAASGNAFIENTMALGDVLAVEGPDGPLGSLEAAVAQESPFALLFSSVLEPVLAATALELPENQVTAVTEFMVYSAAEMPADHAPSV